MRHRTVRPALAVIAVAAFATTGPVFAAPLAQAATPAPALRQPVNVSVCAAPTRTLTGSDAQSLEPGDVAAVPSGQTFTGGLNAYPCTWVAGGRRRG